MFNGWNNEGAADMFGSMMRRQGATANGGMMAGGLKHGGGTMGGYGGGFGDDFKPSPMPNWGAPPTGVSNPMTPGKGWAPDMSGGQKGPAAMPGPPGGQGQMGIGWQGGMNNAMPRPGPGGRGGSEWMPPPNPPAETSGGFGLGPYNPNGKPGSTSGGIPPSNVYNPPGGVPNPRNYSPVNPPGGYPGSYGPVGGVEGGPGAPPRLPYDPFQDRPRDPNPSGFGEMPNPEGGPFGPPRPDPTPQDGPPPVSQDYGNLNGMGFGIEGGRDVTRPRNEDQPEDGPRTSKRGGWDWRQNTTGQDQNYINQRQMMASPMPQFQPEPQFQQPQQNPGYGMGGWGNQMMSPWNY